MENLRPETIAAWKALLTVSRTLLENVEVALKSEGYPPLSWYDALLGIESAGPEGIRPFALKSQLLLQKYGTSRLLDRIVTAGLIERLSCDDDKRGHSVRITKNGIDVRRAMWPVYNDLLRENLASRLTETDAETLAKLLQIVNVTQAKEQQ